MKASLSWQLGLFLHSHPVLDLWGDARRATFPCDRAGGSPGCRIARCSCKRLRPAFLLWALCMVMTAATELGPQKWQESVMTRTAHVSGTMVLVYTSSLMFVMRHFAGPLAHRLSPVGMLTGSAALAAGGPLSIEHGSQRLDGFRVCHRSSVSASPISGRRCSGSPRSDFPKAAPCFSASWARSGTYRPQRRCPPDGQHLRSLRGRRSCRA